MPFYCILYLRFLVGILCFCNLAWISYRCVCSLDHILSVSCTLSSLVFILSKQVTIESTKERMDDSKESTADVLLRKQLQYFNWAIMLNKALTLHQIKMSMQITSKMDRSKQIKRCSSDSFDSKHRCAVNSMKRWKSWTSDIEISDFHSSDCQNVITPPPSLFIKPYFTV